MDFKVIVLVYIEKRQSMLKGHILMEKTLIHKMLFSWQTPELSSTRFLIFTITLLLKIINHDHSNHWNLFKGT